MMHLGVNGLYDLPHHSIVFARDYRKNVDEIFKEKTAPRTTSPSTSATRA